MIVPAVIALGTVLFYRLMLRTKWLVALGIIASLACTYELSNLAVQTKWRIRQQIAVTEEEQEYATADGANLVFTAFLFAPVEATVMTGLWFVILLKLVPNRTKPVK